MEPLETVNKRLAEYYGCAWNGWAIWRIVWSEDQLEKRYGTYTDYSPEGIFLRTVSEVREVPKYRQWITNKWVLERLTVVPEVNKTELSESISYEPMWVFEDSEGKSLPYKWEAAQFVVDTVYAAMGKSNMRKYIDPNTDPERKPQIDKIYEALYGNETPVGDALAHGSGVGYTGKIKEN